jgi:hypothetical protein
MVRRIKDNWPGAVVALGAFALVGVIAGLAPEYTRDGLFALLGLLVGLPIKATPRKEDR